ncbi:N-6 DNA methylase [Tepidibacter mesophilus]|uniref:N-6 DNA methylase n=1 Tax=Tepidibacter mesophilus TaxID=655607 RepID=UPI001651928C|nr:N-6 DNA methylase [Tepidibacter mesophilus]
MIFTRLKAINSSMYNKLWSKIEENTKNIYFERGRSGILNHMIDDINHYYRELGYGETYPYFQLNRSRFNFKPQTEHIILEIIRFLESVPFEVEYDHPRIIAEFFYRVVQKIFNFKRRSNYLDYNTDENVSKIISGITNLKYDDKILDPFIGTGGLLFEIVSNLDYSNTHIIGQDINPELLDICNMLFELLEKKNLELYLGDSIDRPNYQFEEYHGSFDKIITHIPYNLKAHKLYGADYYPNYYNRNYGIGYLKNMNFLIVLNIIEMLNHNGQAYIVVPNNMLYSGGKDKEIRKNIVNDDLIEAIIEFSDYSIYKSSVKPSIIVINNKKEYYKKNKIYLLNVQDDNLEEVIKTYKKYVETDISRVISIDTIASRDYNLNFSHYDSIYDEVQLTLVQKIGVTLHSIVHVVKPMMRKPVKSDLLGIPYIKQSNLNRDSKDVFMDFKNIDDYEHIQDYEQTKIITKKAIIVALQGKDLKPTIFDPQRSNVKEIVLASNCLALIPREDIEDSVDIEYLYYQLYNPRVLRQIDGYKRGTIIKRITYGDLLSVVITKPEYEKQLQLVKDQEEPLKELEKYRKLYEEVSIKAEVEKIKAENKVVNMLIHNVSKHISVIGHDIQVVTKVLEEHNLIDFIYGKEEIEKHNSSPEVRNGLTNKRELVSVKEVLQRTQDRLDLIERTFKDTQKTVNLDLESEDYEEVNVKELIEGIKQDRDLSKPVNYDFIIKGDDPVLNINSQSFIAMIHLLIDNAEEHAFSKFSNSEINNYFIMFNIKKRKGKVIIEYSNNGTKFEMEKEDFILAGRKSNDSNGSGLGGAYLNRVVLSHRGTFDIINSDSGTKFIFTFRIKG